MTKFKLGKDKTTSKIIAITEAIRGLACDCVCPDCEKDFVAAQGNKNDWYFRHYNETTCNGGQETALHLLAKEIIACNSQITLQSHGIVLYDNTVLEKYFQTIKPDVTANTSGQNIFFEVLVTHSVDKVKENFYKIGEYKSIEIDLQNHEFTTRENLENEILNNFDNKRIIFWDKAFNEKSNDNSWFMWLFFLLVTFIGLKFLLPKRKY